MSQLAALLGTYAVGHQLEHDGRTYTFGAIDQAVKVALTKAYFRRAREAVYEMKAELSEAEYAAALQRCTDAYTAGAYDFPQGETFKFFLTAGLPALLHLLTGAPEAELEALVRDRQAEVTHVVLCVVMESFPDVKKKFLQAEAMGLIPPDKLRLLAALAPTT